MSCGGHLRQFRLHYMTDNYSQLPLIMIVKKSWSATALSMVGRNAVYLVFLVDM